MSLSTDKRTEIWNTDTARWGLATSACSVPSQHGRDFVSVCESPLQNFESGPQDVPHTSTSKYVACCLPIARTLTLAPDVHTLHRFLLQKRRSQIIDIAAQVRFCGTRPVSPSHVCVEECSCYLGYRA